MKDPSLVDTFARNIDVAVGSVLVWRSNYTKIGLVAWQKSKGLLLEVIELGGKNVTMNPLWSIE